MTKALFELNSFSHPPLSVQLITSSSKLSFPRFPSFCNTESLKVKARRLSSLLRIKLWILASKCQSSKVFNRILNPMREIQDSFSIF